MRTDTPPQTKYLKDYTPPPYLVDHVDMVFRLEEEQTRVTTTTHYRKNPESTKEDLILNGDDLKLLFIKKDGVPLDKSVDYQEDKDRITLNNPGDKFTLIIETEINPAANTRLEGLYTSNGTFCTQCEAEGFRRITYYQDRPDVLSTFTVRIEADQDKYPVLLSNGDLIEEGTLENETHYAVFKDTTPKPCYLFALVAGNLVHLHDTFTTMSGRNVDLYIYVRKGDENQIDHAMRSLQKSMKWDEEVYGREYQYSRFNIVAVSDFNMGAMENTSLNIFNTALTLAHRDTATDSDFMRVEGVIAHEYFHNWTGNRVTCRDWFQLSLKEGLTVFRDQEFTADMNSRGVKRIDDVMTLRRMQFPEDAGPLAHPIRPDNYIEIDNFYTMTVYEKGAEVIRMMNTLLGPEAYRKGTDLYFERHDGQAVTCDDFVQAMQDAGGLDLEHFKLWYSQAGTPEVSVRSHYDADAKTYSLTLHQTIPDTPGQKNKKPMHIPVQIGLIGPNGQDMHEELLQLKEAEQTFTFEHIGERPVPSILRNFSAPVKLSTDLTSDDLRFLMVHDRDGFNRWEAGQNLALQVLNEMIAEEGRIPPADYVQSYGDLLDRALDEDADKALMARAISIPDIQRIAQEQDIVDTDVIYAARETLLNTLLEAHEDKLRTLYQNNQETSAFSITPDAMGKRALKNSAMLMLMNRLRPDDAVMLKEAYDSCTNMTDRMAAFWGLNAIISEERTAALDDFYHRFKEYPLVIDKWFSAQTMPRHPDLIKRLQKLRKHEDFNIRNPNRVRSLYGAFAVGNPVMFHKADGSGYNFLKEAVFELNTINPQIAARLLGPLREWRRYTPDRQEKMKAVLQAIADLPNISSNVYEIASKSLEG